MQDYWTALTQQRLSRRRAMAATGAGAGIVALSLVGCGSGSSNPKESKSAKSSAYYEPQDSSAKAKSGGVFKGFDTSDPPSMDPLTSPAFQTTSAIAYFAYPRFMKWQTGKYPDTASGVSEGELAESWEVSPDKLQLTLKLRQGMKWDARPPTNGRAIDSQDVVFSWERFNKLNSLAASFSSVASIVAPDAKTVVLKMKFPDSSVVQLLTAATLFYILPREADGGFDPRGDVRGHGPWMLTEVRPSAMRVWSKNPDYYVKGRPYFDKLEMPIVPEYATRLAQLKAGNVWNIDTGGVGAAGVRQEDILSVHKDVPALLLVQSEAFQATPSFITFGYEGDSPFKDTRMRQALSMLIDREAFIDVIDNRDGYRRDGLDLPIAL